MYTCIRYEVSEGIATLTLNRPEVFNAINNTISFEIQDALKKASEDSLVRVLILTGAGKAFCSGQDLKDISAEQQRDLSESLHSRYNPIIRALRQMDKPVICKLNGIAAGAGCSFALACDMIIASEKASMVEVFIHVGLVLDSGSSYFLPRLVGSAKAFELATTGRKVTAREAFDMHMVNKVVKPEELDDAVAELAVYYASAPTQAIGMIKQMLNKSFHSSLDTMLEFEAHCQKMAGNSHDYKEGLAAFLEKRTPQFKGN